MINLLTTFLWLFLYCSFWVKCNCIKYEGFYNIYSFRRNLNFQETFMGNYFHRAGNYWYHVTGNLCHGTENSFTVHDNNTIFFKFLVLKKLNNIQALSTLTLIKHFWKYETFGPKSQTLSWIGKTFETKLQTFGRISKNFQTKVSYFVCFENYRALRRYFESKH